MGQPEAAGDAEAIGEEAVRVTHPTVMNLAQRSEIFDRLVLIVSGVSVVVRKAFVFVSAQEPEHLRQDVPAAWIGIGAQPVVLEIQQREADGSPPEDAVDLFTGGLQLVGDTFLGLTPTVRRAGVVEWIVQMELGEEAPESLLEVGFFLSFGFSAADRRPVVQPEEASGAEIEVWEDLLLEFYVVELPEEGGVDPGLLSAFLVLDVGVRVDVFQRGRDSDAAPFRQHRDRSKTNRKDEHRSDPHPLCNLPGHASYHFRCWSQAQTDLSGLRGRGTAAAGSAGDRVARGSPARRGRRRLRARSDACAGVPLRNACPWLQQIPGQYRRFVPRRKPPAIQHVTDPGRRRPRGSSKPSVAHRPRPNGPRYQSRAPLALAHQNDGVSPFPHLAHPHGSLADEIELLDRLAIGQGDEERVLVVVDVQEDRIADHPEHIHRHQ